MAGNKKEPRKPGKVKAPGPFRRPIPEKQFEKRYLKHIEHPGDRDFLTSCFTREGGNRIIRQDLTKKDADKLKSLLKAIKAHRKGSIQVVPLIIAAAVVAALVFFFTVMLNPLLEGAMETALEAIFEARSDVDNFKLNLLEFSVGLDGITVANRDEPMRNLFQIGRTRFRLRPQAVLQGKVFIEEVRADSILFGTERTVSGALPDKPGKVKPPKPPKPEAPPLVDLKNFDALGLLNREFDKLQTPKLYDETIAVYDQSLAKWKGQADLVKSRAAEIEANAKPILTLNINNLDPRDPRGLEAITNAIRDITTMVNTVQAAANDATALVGGVQDDIDNAKALLQSAQNSVGADFAHLKSYINFESGTAFEALEPSIREILTDAAEQYLDYGQRALEVFEKIKTASSGQAASQDTLEGKVIAEIATLARESAAKPKKEPAFKGRDVSFPSLTYPRFYLGVLASGFTLGDWTYGFDLEGVSSDPDLFPKKPSTLALSFAQTQGRSIDFDGSLDLRNSATERFSAQVEGSGFPFSVEQGFAQAGIGGFSGTTVFDLGLIGKTNGDISGSGRVNIAQARLLNPAGTLAEAVDQAVREAGEVRLGIGYDHIAAGNDRFTLDTNIGDLIKRALEQTVRAYADRAAQELERVLRERISTYIDGRFVSQKELDLLFAAAKGDKSAIDGLKNQLDAKKSEFERRLRGAADLARQEAERIAEEARLEAERQAELLKQEAQRQAEQ
ncbi:MAG: hypothetical protein LBT39_09835, partial [Treponema sp.]|nr:hypothetical protein [Treponema sp.]